MLTLPQANLALPQLLVGADYQQVHEYCVSQLGNDKRTRELFSAHAHPDFIEIADDLEQIRALSEFVNSKPQLADKKIVLLSQADKLNAYAANSLLKVLEEPGVATLFILMSSHSQLLLPTIISRCQVWQLNNNVDKEDIYTKQMEQDLVALWAGNLVTVMQIVDKWQKMCADDVLYWLEMTVAGIIKGCYLGEKQVNIPNARLWEMFDKTRQANKWRKQGMQANQQLTLENILL